MKQLNLSAISYMSSPSNYVLDKILAAIKSFMVSYSDTWTSKCNAQKWSFPQRVSSVKVTKPTASCGFGHIYWWNLLFVLWCPRMQANIRQPISQWTKPWRGEGDFKQRDFGQCVIKNSSLEQYGSRFKQNYWLYFIPMPRTWFVQLSKSEENPWRSNSFSLQLY